ncbi:sensor histidine kinase [Rhizobium oryzicola]|uniref:histidine kinase n=1 Tax=Rhizobium oryzicola TaxID=1232668 RepID=A0ABT8SRA1_9HYPH|nr:HWE histidine kinase domain-containing protein [Rhizobium oryzicola]MDO1580944.1 HWE histidine kinase domain-containing protein [Rhizobium oryzicola]
MTGSNSEGKAKGFAKSGFRSFGASRFFVRENAVVSFLARVPAFRDAVHGSTTGQKLFGYTAAVIISGFASLVRFLVDDYLPPGFPYLTFFPAVILTGFFFGIYPAMLTTLISGIVAWYWFIPPVESFALTPQSITALAFYVAVISIDLGLLQLLLNAYSAQMRATEELTKNLQLQQLVSEEVDHRMKNLLATTSGLIALSQRYATTPQQLGTQLRQRIQAMGHSISLLRGSLHGGQSDIRDVIIAALEPLGLSRGDRLAFEGEQISLNGSSVIALSLIMHELGTNAFKYGALSSDHGRILLTWNTRRVEAEDAEADETFVDLAWQEQGGPAATAPESHGFGTELVRRMGQSLGGECHFEYAPSGLVVRFTMRLASIQA